MGQGHCRKLYTYIALLMLGIAAAPGTSSFAARLEVDQLIENLRNQILMAEKRARANPLFGVKEIKLHISYTVEEKGEESFTALVITGGASVSAHAVQTMEITLAPLKELTVKAPGKETSPEMLVDFRGRGDYTEEDLAKALFAMTDLHVRTRGIGRSRGGLTEVKLSSAIPPIFFEPGSSRVAPEYYPDLDKLGRVLTAPQYSSNRILITGHTDNLGNSRYNRLLSERRAESVKQYLVKHFPIRPDRLVTRGYGASQPIAPNDTPEGRDKNRRIEIVNIGKE